MVDDPTTVIHVHKLSSTIILDLKNHTPRISYLEVDFRVDVC